MGFWGGMVYICIIAYNEGSIARLVYGVDSYGFTCGKSTTFMGSTIDLSTRKNLYYLYPLDLLTPGNIPYAKSVCVDSCPNADTCGFNSFPCSNDAAFRCPYYAFSQDNLTGRLTGVDNTSVQYYANLVTMKSANDSSASLFISSLQSMNLSWVNNYLSTKNVYNGGSVVTGSYYQLKSQFPGKGPCYPVWVPTVNYFSRCVPQFNSNFTSEVVKVVNNVAGIVSPSVQTAFTDEWNSMSSTFSRYVGDISKGILIICVSGLGSSLILCMFWLIVLRYFAGLMAWLTIILVNLALAGITIYCFMEAGMLGDNAFASAVSSAFAGMGDPTALQRSTWRWIAIAAAAVAGIVLLITLLMISRIKVAIACIKVASQAVGAMPWILLYPVLPFALMVGLVVYWVSVTAMLYSAGTLVATCRSPSSYQAFGFSSLKNFSASSTSSGSYNSSTGTVNCYTSLTGDALQLACSQDPNCYLSYQWNNTIRYFFIYHFFGLLWTNQFIVGLSCVTIAGAIGSFYWAGGIKENMPDMPVFTAMKNTFVYHMGSIAFGSLIIAIVQFIRQDKYA